MTTETDTRTLVQLRKDCKAIGVAVSKKTLSWGPHLTFKVAGVDVDSVLSLDFYEMHQGKLEQLELIRYQFTGMRIDGQKVYGISPN